MCLKKIIVFCCLVTIITGISFNKGFAQESGKLDAVSIAKEYYNSIVKILLFDSIAEKAVPGSGYLGRGSGFIVTEDGIVFTNKHVVEYCMEYMEYKYFSPSDRKYYNDVSIYNPSYLSDPEILNINFVRRATPIIQVFTDKNGSNYKLYIAKLISLDTENFDGAILQIVSDIKGNPVNEKFHPVPIGNSDETNQGEDLCLFGFPAQYDNAGFDLMLRDQSTLTFGKHSGFDYVFNPIYGYIKTDASVNSGNSGGPVINPSNKIIGIASATGNTTNIGLIGGINAMYNVVSTPRDFLDTYRKIDILKAGMGINVNKLKQGKICKLLDELSEKGLTKPQRNPLKNTTILFSKQQVPSQKIIDKSNVLKKNERKFKGPADFFILFYSLFQNNKFSIDENSDISSYGIILNPNKTFEIKTKNEFGFEYGHLFTLARISNSSKISLAWSFISGIGSRDWSSVNIYSDTAGSQISYESKAEFFRFGGKLGLNYSYLFLRRFPVDFYYKFTGAREETNQIGTFRNNQYSFQSSDRGEVYYGGATFLHSIGFNFRNDFYFIGLEYSFGKSKLDFKLPYIETRSYWDGSQEVNHYIIVDAKASAINRISSLKLTLGFMFGGGKKWKKLLIKQYKASL